MAESNEVVNRPNRIGREGVTDRWSFREDTGITLAGREQARADGITLSDVMRAAGRAYLKERGWDIDHLMSKDRKVVDAEWLARMGRKAPRARATRAKRVSVYDYVDPGDTYEMF